MPYVMPWHLTCLAVDAQASIVQGVLLRLTTAYRLRISKTLGNNQTPLEKSAVIDPRDLFLEAQPNDRDAHFNWTIKRAPADRPLPLIVLSSSAFGIRTHFWAGRTGPCTRAKCDACEAGRLSRWSGYLACVDPADWTQVLFEYTPPAAEQLQKMLAAQGYLRGSKIIASRSKKVKNARVNITGRGLYEHLDRLPKEPDILPILFHIWGLKARKDMEAQAYDRDSLPEGERPKVRLSPITNPEIASVVEQVAKDLPGQQKLFEKNGRRKAAS